MRHGRQDYRSVGASPGIDVLSVHDYYGSAPLGGDQWDGMAVRFAQAKALNKPIITGEVGIKAGIGQSGCMSLQQRALAMSAKMAAQFAAGDSAFLVWDWLTDPLGPCSYNSGPRDSPLLSAHRVVAGRSTPKSRLSSECLGQERRQARKSRYRPAIHTGTRMNHLPCFPNHPSKRRYESPRSTKRQSKTPDRRQQRPIPAGSGRIHHVIRDARGGCLGGCA